MVNKILEEARQFWYWLHLGIISIVVLFLLQLFTGGNMLTIKNILFSIPLLAVGDIVAHLITGRT